MSWNPCGTYTQPKLTSDPIPKPKVGRHNKNIILREDELMVGQKAMQIKQMEKAKQKEEMALKNTLQGNYWAGG